MSSQGNLFIPRSVKTKQHIKPKDTAKHNRTLVTADLNNKTSDLLKAKLGTDKRQNQNANIDSECCIEGSLKTGNIEKNANNKVENNCIIIDDTEINLSNEQAGVHITVRDRSQQVISTDNKTPLSTLINDNGYGQVSRQKIINVGPLSPKKLIPLYRRGKRPPEDESLTTAISCFTKVRKMEHESRRPNVKPKPSTSRRNEGYKPPRDLYIHPRHWEYTDLGIAHNIQPPEEKGLTFTVMSYNVLAQNLLEDHMQLYQHCSSKVLRWNYRKNQLRSEISYLRPDIICLQEVYFQHYKDFFNQFLQKLGYEGIYVRKSEDKFDGCATFYKTSKFSLDTSTPVYYKRPEGGSVLNRDNVALIVKLKPRSAPSGRRLVVSNTHLLFNPRRGDIKLAQLMILLAEMDKICYCSPNWPDVYHPLIMCGDFNSLPQSDIYKFLRMGTLNYTGLVKRNMSLQEEACWRDVNWDAELEKTFFPKGLGINDSCKYKLEIHRRNMHQNGKTNVEISLEDVDEKIVGSTGTGTLVHHLRLMSVYNHKLARYNFLEDEITTHHSGASCTVDYIFYGVRGGLVGFEDGEVKTKDVEQGPLKLLGRYGLLAKHELARMGSLPNKNLCSDHLCIMAKFFLT